MDTFYHLTRTHLKVQDRVVWWVSEALQRLVRQLVRSKRIQRLAEGSGEAALRMLTWLDVRRLDTSRTGEVRTLYSGPELKKWEAAGLDRGLSPPLALRDDPGTAGAVRMALGSGEEGWEELSEQLETADKERQTSVWDLHLEERLDRPVSLCRGLLELARGQHGLLADPKEVGGDELLGSQSWVRACSLGKE